MYITVSLKIDLDTTANLSQMERQIQDAGREAMKQALAQAIHQSGEQQKSCPECGSEQVQTQGTKQRVLLTSLDEWKCLSSGCVVSSVVISFARRSAVWLRCKDTTSRRTCGTWRRLSAVPGPMKRQEEFSTG